MTKSKINLSKYFAGKVISGRTLVFVIIFLIAIITRLCISFSNELFLGVNGGYYPLQVRHVLNTGLLAFKDVPLYFYLCASILKTISVFGLVMSNETIIFVIKVIDSIVLPLLLIPLFKIIFKKEGEIPIFSAIAIALFMVFSFPPFMMLGDLQKNAFAIPFLFVFIYYLENYLFTHEKRNVLFVIISLILLAIAHFGVFVYGLVFLMISLFLVYRKKAILPAIIAFSAAFVIILLFDYNRAFRLLTLWNVIFNRPALFEGPLQIPILINILFSYCLAVFGVFQYRKFKKELSKATAYMILLQIVLMVVFAFPLFSMDYFLRFNLFLFIPQALLILNLIRTNKKLAVPFSIVLVLLTTASIFMYSQEGKKPCMDNESFRDLQNINKYIPKNRDSTIIITMHGIEFWTAWALNIKVANDRAMDKIVTNNYKNMIILQPKKGFENRPFEKKPRPGGPFHKLPIPENYMLIYSSNYFNAYQNKK